MTNTGIIITLAYPETIVRVSHEWVLRYLGYIGIGKKNYVRAGHAALLLIDKETGKLDYHDFGRYITPEFTGRVRGKDTDCELNFPLKAIIENDEIINLKDILIFMATHPKLTHGEGTLYASVCQEVNYKSARDYITKLQNQHFIKYAVFIKNATNCARFVTDTLIASVTNAKMKKNLIRSKWFTPSTIGNVVLSQSNNQVYQVDQHGHFLDVSVSVGKINRACFLDRLVGFQPNYLGNLQPKQVANSHSLAQWLSGIGAGAWFELHPTSEIHLYLFKRISAYGNVDVEAVFEVEDTSFSYEKGFEFSYNSNCLFFHVKQENQIFKFNRISK